MQSLALTYAMTWVATAFAATPNIVYILADDMGIGDISTYTSTARVPTPNIDSLATNGMRFDNAHSASSVCSPTRYGLLTGRYGWRGPLLAGVVNPHGVATVASSQLTAPEMLKSVGYDTALIGKWHLGVNWAKTNGNPPAANGSNIDYSQPFTGGPIDHGFDTFFGIDASANFPPYAFIRDNQTIGIPQGLVNGNPVSHLNRPGPIVPGFSIADVLPATTNEAVSYISSKANGPNPFFLYFPMTAPHEPLLPLDQQIVPSTGKGPYGDFVAAVDWSVGRILDVLADPNDDGNTADSIVNNTIVIFASDNGAHKAFSFSDSTGYDGGVPLRGDKATVYEGGNRVPFLLQWKNQVPSGVANSNLAELNDFMATAADIVGFNLTADAAPDSISLASEIFGTSSSAVRSFSSSHSFAGAMTIRQVDASGNEWKLIFSSNDGGFTGSRINPANPITDYGLLQMFNLTVDPGESTNLLAGGGTQAMKDKADELRTLLNQMINAGRSAPTKSTGDFNGDHVVDLDDWHAWRAAFGSSTNLAADGNGNGVIDAGDYVIWRQFYVPAGGGGSQLANAMVPEPGTCWMVATVGPALLHAFSRRRRSSPRPAVENCGICRCGRAGRAVSAR